MANPSSTIALRVLEAEEARDDTSVNRELDLLVQVLNEGEGYSRLVAGRVLLTIFRVPQMFRFINQSRADSIASLIRLSKQPMPDFIPFGDFAAFSKQLSVLVQPDCAIEVDGRTVGLMRGLPVGWCVEAISADIDGIPIRLKGGGIHELREIGERPVVSWNASQDPQLKVGGKHRISRRCIVAAPSGHTVLLSDVIVVDVLTKTQTIQLQKLGIQGPIPQLGERDGSRD